MIIQRRQHYTSQLQKSSRRRQFDIHRNKETEYFFKKITGKTLRETHPYTEPKSIASSEAGGRPRSPPSLSRRELELGLIRRAAPRGDDTCRMTHQRCRALMAWRGDAKTEEAAMGIGMI